MRIINHFNIFLTALAFFFIFTSCSNTKPEIQYGFIQLVQYESGAQPDEYYSFFILAEDEDGFENLEELYIYHDREQLRWHIKSNDWISYNEDDNNWIGTRSLAVSEGSLPRGTYRAVLINKGGEKGERSFTYDGSVRYPFPQITVAEGRYAITSDWPVNRLVCYDREGNYAATVALSSLTGNISELNLPSAARTAALWAEDPAYFCSAFTNVVSIR
ncbi:MAG: hypothetical protein FWC03_00765 [Treponema sp.]|nr:hypothetical protein [Treponema sp.]